jgi:hypothetical protein
MMHIRHKSIGAPVLYTNAQFIPHRNFVDELEIKKLHNRK